VSARVVGLDLSMTSTGIAHVEGMTATFKPRKTGDARLLEIYEEIWVSASVADVDLVVIEEAPPGLKGPAIKAIHMVHGAIRLGLIESDVRYIAVNPTTLKQFATGKASADKTAMAMALYKRTGLELPTNDEVDAWWLRAAGHELLGEPLVTLPAAQVAALDKIRDSHNNGGS
jgi:Holliday junction resolvasome RuvABC endonuclease subunit